jgi:hypothetical protein
LTETTLVTSGGLSHAAESDIVGRPARVCYCAYRCGSGVIAAR